MKAVAIHGGVAAMVTHNTLTIFEAQNEFEGSDGTVIPAKSIWLNTAHAKTLRDFLNEQFPTQESENYLGVFGALKWIAQHAEDDNIRNIAMNALGWKEGGSIDA
jgi:hypothetical protein